MNDLGAHAHVGHDVLHSSTLDAIPLSRPSTTAISDAAEACERALRRWRQTLAEQDVLLSRLIEKALRAPAIADGSGSASLAAAGLPVRLLHIRVQSNLQPLDTHVRNALCLVQPFVVWQTEQSRSSERHESPFDGHKRNYNNKSSMRNNGALSSTCHQATCFLAQLHELCDLQAEATRSLDMQLWTPTPAPSASFPADLLAQMRDITQNMMHVADSLWHALETVLTTTTMTSASFPPAPPLRGESACLVTPKDAQRGGGGHPQNSPHQWLTDVMDTNAAAESFLDHDVSPPTRQGSYEDRHTVAVLVASPSPLARRLHWRESPSADREERLEQPHRQRRSHSRGSTSSLGSASPPTAMRELPSLSPWRPEDEGEGEPPSVVARRDKDRVPGVPSSPLQLRERAHVNALVSRASRKQTSVPPSPGAAENGGTAFYTAASHDTPETRATDMFAKPEPTWSIPPPLLLSGGRLREHMPTQTEATAASQRDPPSSVGMPSVNDVEEEEVEDDVVQETRNCAPVRSSPLVAMERRCSVTDADGRDDEEASDVDDEEDDDDVTRTPPSLRGHDAAPSSSPSPPSPLTHDALQTLRRTYDRRTARLEKALQERESTIARLQRAQQQQQQQPLPEQSTSSAPLPLSTPWGPQMWGMPPIGWHNLLPKSSPAMSEATQESLTHLQQEIDGVRQQQAEILSLLRSSKPRKHDDDEAQQEEDVLLQECIATDAATTGTRRGQRQARHTAQQLPTSAHTALETSAENTTSDLFREIQARNERLQRDNIQLKKRLFALELDARRSATLAPSAGRQGTGSAAATTTTSTMTKTNTLGGVARPRVYLSTSPTCEPVERVEGASVQERRRAVLEKLFAQGNRSQVRTSSTQGDDVGEEEEQGESDAAGTTQLLDTRPTLSAMGQTRVPIPHPHGTVSGANASQMSASSSSHSFFARNPSLSFLDRNCRADADTHHVALSRAMSAPPLPGRAASSRIKETPHPYNNKKNNTDKNHGNSTERMHWGTRPRTGPSAPAESALPPLRTRASSASLPLLRHHAWRLGHDEVEENAIELLSRPVGHRAMRTQQQQRTPTIATVPSRATAAPPQASRELSVHRYDGTAAEGQDTNTSPLQTQRARVWRALHAMATPPHLQNSIDDVSVSPLTEARSPPPRAAAAAQVRENEVEIVEVTVEGEERADARFPMPAYMAQKGTAVAARTNRGAGSASSVDGAWEPTLLTSPHAPSPSPPPPQPSSRPVIYPSMAARQRSATTDTKRHTRTTASTLYDPLGVSTAQADTSPSPPPPPPLPRGLPAGDVERRLSLSRSTTISSDDITEETTRARSHQHHDARTASSEPLRGRSRTLPPSAPAQQPPVPADRTVRRGHAKDDLLYVLEAERASLTSTLERLCTQREDIAEKRETLHRLVADAAATTKGSQRTAELHRLLQRLEKASEAVEYKAAQLFAERDRVMQQLQLLVEDAF